MHRLKFEKKKPPITGTYKLIKYYYICEYYLILFKDLKYSKHLL